MIDRCPVCGADYHGTPFCTGCGSRLIPPARPAPLPAPAAEPPASLPPIPVASAPAPFAGLGQRAVAFLLDAMMVGVTALGLGLAASAAWWIGAGSLPDGYWEDGFYVWWFILAGVLAIVYQTVFVGGEGQTPGKAALGIVVIDAGGRRRVGYGRAFVRALGYEVSWALAWLGYLWAIWDPCRQTWHDKMADTLVVRKNH